MTAETTGTLAAALSKAQAEITNPAPNDRNPHFKSDFTNLAGCLDAVKPALAKHGVAIVQAPSWSEGILTVRTILMHGSESVECALSCKANGDPQKIGSSITYLRRYGLCAMVGISSDKDDDGNAGSEGARPFAGDRRQPAQRPQPITPATNTALNAALKAVGVSSQLDADAVCSYVTEGAVPSFPANMTEASAQAVLKELAAAKADGVTDILSRARADFGGAS